MSRPWHARRGLRLLLLGAIIVLVGLAGSVLRAPVMSHPPEWTHPRIGMAFVLIQPGTFQMGTPPEEAQREPGEVLRGVTISRAFYMARHEVTQGQWQAVMGSNPSHFQDCGPRCPVERVSFLDVEQFLARMNAEPGPRFRLPTEAEWEYACRAGGPQPFGHASSLSSRDANINGNYPYNAPKGSFRERPVQVGYFPANPWGLHDMSGNVWEWVQDWHCPYETTETTDPVGQCDSGLRVIRGGSWLFDGASARCGLRYTHRPQDKGYSLGLRLVREAS